MQSDFCMLIKVGFMKFQVFLFTLVNIPDTIDNKEKSLVPVLQKKWLSAISVTMDLNIQLTCISI